jgi:hypothetical protein
LRSPIRHCIALIAIALAPLASPAQPSPQSAPLLSLDRPTKSADFPIVANGHATAIYIAPQNPDTVRVAAAAFANDVAQVTGAKPRILTSLKGPLPPNLIVVGVLGKTPEFDKLRAAHRLITTAVDNQWEAAETVTILNPPPAILHGVRNALIIAAADRRGAAYALFALSRQMGVSPWTWWADVPIAHHTAVYVHPGLHVQPEPSVQYRGIFLNDEDWGLRPWATKKMDPTVDSAGGNGQPAKGNIGPNTYTRIFELLLRLHANSLWPAMHPGSLAFNAVPENAKLADQWGIVMGSSHADAMNAYWDKRLQVNGKYENFYTVGLRGVHDSGLEATGSPEVKAHLVEDAMTAQRKLLATRVNPDVAKISQIIWLYKESLDLYRVGMKVPDDVTLGWTDDNYGYIRELPNAAEQARSGGSGVYYHVSYWGAPHDHLWLSTMPPALLEEELTKAYDHNARKYWILNVGDLKPAEIDIDYFMQLATDEPRMAAMSQHDFLTQWSAEQFPGAPSVTASSSRVGSQIADLLTHYYALNFIRKPEFMGFNGYNDGINRTAFNPLAWPANGEPDQNHARAAAWSHLRDSEQAIAKSLPPQYASAFFELIGYPIEASAAQNEKFLAADLTYLDAAQLNPEARAAETERARNAYNEIQSLTARYNSLENGKWDGIMSAAPRQRHVFEMPRTATDADTTRPLPPTWAADNAPIVQHPTPPPPGFHEEHGAVSINAAHFTRKFDGAPAHWNILADLGISGDSVIYGAPGLLANASPSTPTDAPWLDYDFTTRTDADATLTLHLLPTFPVDSDHHLRYAVSLDSAAPIELDLSAPAVPRKSLGAGDGPSDSGWSDNVLRNSAVTTIPLGPLASGKHTLRLLYRDPGVVFEHLVIAFPSAPPAYPVPPETN